MLSLFLSGAADVAVAVLDDDIAGLDLRLDVEVGLLSVVDDRVGLLTEVLDTAGLMAPPLIVEVEVAVEVRLIGAGAGCLVPDARSLAVVAEMVDLVELERSVPDVAIDIRFGLAVMPTFSFFDSSSVALSVALLSFDAVDGCGLCSEGVEVVLVVDTRGLLAPVVLEESVLGLVDVDALFRLGVEVEDVVADGGFLEVEDTVGLLSLSATDGGRAAVELVKGFVVEVGFLTVAEVVEPVVAAVFERLIPGLGAGVGADADPGPDEDALAPSSAVEAWLRDAGRSMLYTKFRVLPIIHTCEIS